MICICSFRCSRKRRRAWFGLAVCETRLFVCAPNTACECVMLYFSSILLTFHYWLYSVWLCMWRIIKNLEPWVYSVQLFQVLCLNDINHLNVLSWQGLNAHANDKLSWQRAAVACQLSWASFLGLSQSVEIAGDPTQLRAPIIVTIFHPTSDGPADIILLYII